MMTCPGVPIFVGLDGLALVAANASAAGAINGASRYLPVPLPTSPRPVLRLVR